MRQLVGAMICAPMAASMMIVCALCLGHGTAQAVTFPALIAQDSQAKDALLPSDLTDAPSLEVALLGDEPSEDHAIFDAVIDAPNGVAPASADSLEDFATEGDAYSVTESGRGFESSGIGRGWGGPLVAAGIAAGILARESSRDILHGFRFGNPGTPQDPGTPSSTPSLGPDDVQGDDPPADVPEPGTMALLAAGIAISAAFRRRLTRA